MYRLLLIIVLLSACKTTKPPEHRPAPVGYWLNQKPNTEEVGVMIMPDSVTFELGSKWFYISNEMTDEQAAAFLDSINYKNRMYISGDSLYYDGYGTPLDSLRSQFGSKNLKKFLKQNGLKQ